MAKKKVKKLFRGGPPGIGGPPGFPGFGPSPTPPGFGGPTGGGARGSVETIRDTSTEALDQLAQASSALGTSEDRGALMERPYKKGGKVKKSKKSSRPRGYGITKRGIKKTKYL